MTHREFQTWVAYREKYGPLNPVRKYDAGLAVVASQLSNAFGGHTKPSDFMPYGKEPDKEVDAPGFIAALGKGVKVGR